MTTHTAAIAVLAFTHTGFANADQFSAVGNKGTYKIDKAAGKKIFTMQLWGPQGYIKTIGKVEYKMTEYDSHRQAIDKAMAFCTEYDAQ
jgi:hypothetical protein